MMARITIRVPDELMLELERLRRNLNRDNKRLKATTSDLVRAALLAYVNQWKFVAWAQGSYKLQPKSKRGPPEPR
jgi:predicted transcriptional regulator